MSKMIGITELRDNAKKVIDGLGKDPVVILSRSRPVAMLVHPDAWDALDDRIDELEAQLAIERASNDTIPYSEVDLGLDEG